MLHLIKRTPKSTFESLYDTHSASLFGIIFNISRNKKEAEEILVRSFKTFFMQTSTTEIPDRTFLHLLRIAVCIASEQLDLPKETVGRIILETINHKDTVAHISLPIADSEFGTSATSAYSY